ncbi:TrkH family potassium uptake protein [candidate division KSB1 bacterium]|nr:TrkH family potassium uptake protein [candidate division KSB1 bacterium]
MRKNENLVQHYRVIFSYTGYILFLVGLIMLTPLLAILGWRSEMVHLVGFVFPACILMISGFTVWKLLRLPKSVVLTVQEGGVIVLLSWLITLIFSSLPLIFVIKLNFTQAVFESVSGWTTTGLSVVDVTKAPKIILLWRSIMQLFGGAGFAIIMLTAIAGPVGPGFSIAEGRSDQLVPNVRQSARLVMSIYLGYILVAILTYWLCGMGVFDAINHAFAALSTGGFSTHPESIGYWNDVNIEAFTIIFMIFGNLNFLTAYMLLRGKIKPIYRNGELRLLAVVIPVSFLILFLLVTRIVYTPFDKSIRVAIFETVSAITTTGFSTVSYVNWNPMGYFVLTLLMLIGGGTCSTAGGIKQFRIYLMFKTVIWEVRRAFLPRTVVVENYFWQSDRETYINDDRIRQIAVFFFTYLIIFFAGSGILVAHGYILKDAFFEFASSLGTVGLSIGITAPDSPPLVLWAQSLGMFLGRLEIFIVLISIGKLFLDFQEMLCPVKS